MGTLRIPAIRATMGIWCYYIAVLTFEQVKDHVQKVDQELHDSKTLREMIQRSITDNYKNIKAYLLSQEERFFNSLVLAVYDGDPEWVEVELNYKEKEYFDLGFLEFTGDEKIFPVDGQHRVEGIKAAIKENESLIADKVPVIFIGHKNDSDGMQKSRRLFSTLNRYAKPVSDRDIIALDEDDAAAIVTRSLVEEFYLFKGDRIVYVAGKAIPDSNKTAFTSIVTLYQCNTELLKYFLHSKHIKKRLKDYIRYRPSDGELKEFKEFCFNFWKSFSAKIDAIDEYLKLTSSNPASSFRDRELGGNILFRPIGLLPFVMASIELCKQLNIDFETALHMLNNVELSLNEEPWLQVLWNDISNTMLRADNNLAKLLMIYQIDKNLLSGREISKLKTGYASKIGIEVNYVETRLKDIEKKITVPRKKKRTSR